ncbi:MAG: hypothetical protein DHS20C05_06710 [Hyphococcus sp.]|nr:MAG: hypothetical protein DHS20C05_06710 [Marinicaulis sp.]
MSVKVNSTENHQDIATPAKPSANANATNARNSAQSVKDIKDSKEVLDITHEKDNDERTGPSGEVGSTKTFHLDNQVSSAEFINIRLIKPTVKNSLVEGGPRLHVKTGAREALNQSLEMMGGNLDPIWLVKLGSPTSEGYLYEIADGGGRFSYLLANGHTEIYGRVLPSTGALAEFAKWSANFSITKTTAAENILSIGKMFAAYEKQSGTSGATKGGRGKKGTASTLADKFEFSKKIFNEGKRLFDDIGEDGLRLLGPTGFNKKSTIAKVAKHPNKGERKRIITWAAANPGEISFKKALKALGLKGEAPVPPPKAELSEAEQMLMLDESWAKASVKVQNQWLVTKDLRRVGASGSKQINSNQQETNDG